MDNFRIVFEFEMRQMKTLMIKQRSTYSDVHFAFKNTWFKAS